MKIHSTAIAFFAAASFPLQAAATTYSCSVDADYKIEDDASNPTYPTSSEKDWAASKVQSSYQAVHDSGSGGDFDMPSNSWTDFTLTEARVEEGSSSVKTVAHLRGGSDVKIWTIYDGRLYNGATITCTLCSEWDDDDAWTLEGEDAEKGIISKREQDWLSKMLSATETHDRWVEAYCDELQQGPHSVFEYAYDCAITLYDCTTMAEGEDKATDTEMTNAIKIAIDIDESFHK